METTYYIDKDNNRIKSHAGRPRKISAFEKNADNAVKIEIWEYRYCSHKTFNLQNGEWVGKVWMRTDGKGGMREVLVPKRTQMHIVTEQISLEETRRVIDTQREAAMGEARNAISWCDPADEKDENGRYWISAYHGCGVYRLVVKDGKILGSIQGGFHGSKSMDVCDDAWKEALIAAIGERVQGEYHLIKADGSGTYFYARSIDDLKYLGNTKEYDVPDARGGFHHNIEIR